MKMKINSKQKKLIMIFLIILFFILSISNFYNIYQQLKNFSGKKIIKKTKTERTQEAKTKEEKEVKKIYKKTQKLRGYKNNNFKNTIEKQAQKYPHTFFLESPIVEKKIYLTFDDGPEKIYTKQILDILKRENIKASFFVIGENINYYPETVKRIIEEGHTIGHHSYDHINFQNYKPEYVFETQIKRTNQILKEKFNIETNLLRPPYGVITNQQIEFFKKLGYKIINWSIDTIDWNLKLDKNNIINRIKDQKHEGAIILMHSGGGNRKNTVESLSEIISILKKENYQFSTIDDFNKF